MALNRLAVDLDLHLQMQHRRYASGAVERISGIDLIDPMLDGDLLRRGRHRVVVQAGAVQTEQVSLRFQWQFIGVAL
jgi:hypothetical protein